MTRITYKIDKSRGIRWAGRTSTRGRMGNAHNNLFGRCDGDEYVVCVCVCVCENYIKMDLKEIRRTRSICVTLERSFFDYRNIPQGQRQGQLTFRMSVLIFYKLLFAKLT